MTYSGTAAAVALRAGVADGNRPKTLGQIRHAGSVEIVELLSDCVRAGRLAALGFLPGCQVRISHVAPLGDPISVAMDGQEISVRRAEANLIAIRELL